MSLQIVPFYEDYLEDAARLVCARFLTLRCQVPVLPECYTRVDAFLPRLQDLLQKGLGVAALDGGKLTGFLHGFVLPHFLGKRSLFSPEWANAARLDSSARIYEEMYAWLSGDWVDSGCDQHIITLLANDSAGLDAWRWLGFGMAATDAIRDLSPLQPPPTWLEIYRAGVLDLPESVRFADALAQHIASPPIFWPHAAQDMQSRLENPEFAQFMACANGKTLGVIGLEPGYTDACLVSQDKQTITITSAYTLEQARCQGVAHHLLSHALGWAGAQGYVRCAVDFEAANYLAHRFWLTHFQPVCYSLLRSIPTTRNG